MARAVPSMAGQVVILTGAGSGIGAAAAHELKARGAFPILVDIDRHMIEPLALALGERLQVAVPLAERVAVAQARGLRPTRRYAPVQPRN